MSNRTLIVAARCLALIAITGFSGVVAAENAAVDLKSIWNSLTPEEQAAYAAAAKSPAAGLPAASSRTPGDTCAAATLEVSSLPFADSNTTVGLTDDLVFAAACGGFNASSGLGPDLVYRVQTDVDCGVNVALDPAAADLALWVVTDCADPVGGCVGGDDSGGNGTIEEVAFTATGGQEYFVVVDGFGGASDAFDLSITETTATGCTLVPVELQHFDVD